MSTPTFNSIGVTRVNTFAFPSDVASLIDGNKWGGAVGTGVKLTFSFPGLISYFRSGYGEGEPNSFLPLTAADQAGVIQALSAWHLIANVSFTQTVDTALTVGDLRFARTSIAVSGENAHTYTPGSYPDAGDAWFNNASWHTASDDPIVQGTYDFFTILHEIGHALGLKHPFEGSPQIAAKYDSYSYTLMSYSASIAQHGNNGANFYPTTPMWFDILTMEDLYGATPHNSGRTVYNFFSGAHYWQTIDDSGGNDTIQFFGPDASTIDLRIGHWCNLGAPIFFDAAPSQASTVMIGPRSAIENATGGSGADLIIGNGLANRLSGSDGNDSISGNAGNDLINGGLGADRLKGGSGHDMFQFSTALGTIDNLVDFSVRDDTIKLAKSIFTGIGPVLDAAEFFRGADAATPREHIVYTPGTGALSFDPDGKGGAPEIEFATLARNLHLSAADFVMG